MTNPSTPTNKEDIRIRPMRLADLPQADAIFSLALPVVERKVRHYSLARQKGAWVAATSKKVVGFYVAWQMEGARTVWLDYVAVDPREQRARIGSNLVEHCESAAQSAGMEAIELAVRADNSEVIPFYLKRGYEEVRKSSTPPSVVFRKQLAPLMGKEPPITFGGYSFRVPSEALHIILAYTVLSAGKK